MPVDRWTRRSTPDALRQRSAHSLGWSTLDPTTGTLTTVHRAVVVDALQIGEAGIIGIEKQPRDRRARARPLARPSADRGERSVPAAVPSLRHEAGALLAVIGEEVQRAVVNLQVRSASAARPGVDVFDEIGARRRTVAAPQLVAVRTFAVAVVEVAGAKVDDPLSTAKSCGYDEGSSSYGSRTAWTVLMSLTRYAGPSARAARPRAPAYPRLTSTRAGSRSSRPATAPSGRTKAILPCVALRASHCRTPKESPRDGTARTSKQIACGVRPSR